MTHVYHDDLPGYSPNQILVDGCGECERRSERDDHGLSALDNFRFARAWIRAIAWENGVVRDVSHAEAPLLRYLYQVDIRLQQAGVDVASQLLMGIRP